LVVVGPRNNKSDLARNDKGLVAERDVNRRGAKSNPDGLWVAEEARWLARLLATSGREGSLQARYRE